MTTTRSVRLHSPERDVLEEAAGIVLRGGVIVYPTETLYGIGADARNADAVAKVARSKNRKDDKPILAIVDSREMLEELVAEVPPLAESLMQQFWPGPLTIVFTAAQGIPHALTQGTGTIGIRIPSSNVCLELLRRSGCPLTSTSANVSGEPVHRTIAEIRKAVNEGIDLYLDAGTLPESKPSTVISLVGKPKLFREGVIAFDTLQKILPSLERA